MVKSFSRNVISAVLLLASISGALAKDVAEYRIGDQVTENIVTPVALMVVDPAATDALKEKESQRIPVVFRFDKTAATVVETELRETVSLARSNFVQLMNHGLGDLERHFGVQRS